MGPSGVFYFHTIYPTNAEWDAVRTEIYIVKSHRSTLYGSSRQGCIESTNFLSCCVDDLLPRSLFPSKRGFPVLHIRLSNLVGCSWHACSNETCLLLTKPARTQKISGRACTFSIEYISCDTSTSPTGTFSCTDSRSRKRTLEYLPPLLFSALRFH